MSTPQKALNAEELRHAQQDLREAARRGECADPAPGRAPFLFLPDESGKQVLDGRYELFGELGHGGMGVVYRAWDRKVGREVAVKFLPPALVAKTTAVERLKQEAKAIATLQHPGVVRLFDVGEIHGSPYLVMELLQGRTLEDELTQKTLAVEPRVRILQQVAEAVHAAHEIGVVHRDLKPGNIMLETSGRVVVMDFGLARRRASETRLTGEGDVLGTPLYMAPEQILGDRGQVDARTDVYAMGVVLYELLAGHPPYQGALAEIFHDVLHGDPPPPSRHNRETTPEFDAICRHAMAREPRDRYPSAQALSDDLRRALAGEPIAAKPTARWRRFLGRRRRALWAAGLATIVTLAVGVAIRSSRPEPAAPPPPHTRSIEELEQAVRTELKEADRWDQGINPHPSCQKAETLCREILSREPGRAWAHQVLGQIFFIRGEYERKYRKKDPSAHFTQSLAALQEAIRLVPDSWPAYLLRGTLRIRWGWRTSATPGVALAYFERADDDLTQALLLKSRGSSAIPDQLWRERAMARSWLLRMLKQVAPGDPRFRSLDAQALADFDEAVKRTSPKEHENHSRRGDHHEFMERWADALLDYEEARKIAPGETRWLDDDIKRLRARVKQ